MYSRQEPVLLRRACSSHKHRGTLQAPCPGPHGLRCPSQEGDSVQEGPVLTGTEAAGEQGCRAVSPMLSTAGGSLGRRGASRSQPREQGQGCQPPHSVQGDKALVSRQRRRMESRSSPPLADSCVYSVPAGTSGEQDLPVSEAGRAGEGCPTGLTKLSCWPTLISSFEFASKI